MEVSFKGFKNVGAERVSLSDLTGRKSVATILNCELTNDFKGKDLDNFSGILKRFPNKNNPRFLNISLYQYFKSSQDYPDNDIILINDKECDIKNKNLGVLEKIAELLKTIMRTQSEEFKVNQDYLESDDFYNSYLFIDPSTDKEILDVIHKPSIVRRLAGHLLEAITNAVDEALT